MTTLADISIKNNSSWNTYLNLIYPVGSVYFSYTSTSPATRFGGTWSAISGRFIYTGGTGTGGNNNAAVISHNHTASTGSSGSHSHNAYNPASYASFGLFISGTGANAGVSASHYLPSGTSSNLWTRSAGSTQSAGSHTHTVTVASKGESATNRNMPLYQQLYCWRRTA